MGRDPIEEAGGLNLYGFVGNNAINRWDLLGMWWEARSYTIDGVTHTQVGWIPGVDPEDNQFDTSADYWYASDGSGTITAAQANEMIFQSSGWTGDPRTTSYYNGVPMAGGTVEFMATVSGATQVVIDPHATLESLIAELNEFTATGQRRPGQSQESANATFAEKVVAAINLARAGLLIKAQSLSADASSALVALARLDNALANYDIRILETNGGNAGGGVAQRFGVVHWNPNLAVVGQGVASPPYLTFLHELVHAIDNVEFNNRTLNYMRSTTAGPMTNLMEVSAMTVENLARPPGSPPRTVHNADLTWP